MVDTLENVGSVELCQMNCLNNSKCEYFVHTAEECNLYDSMKKVVNISEDLHDQIIWIASKQEGT